MTTLKEAAAMALDALELMHKGCTESPFDGWTNGDGDECGPALHAAHAALRAALSAPADVPESAASVQQGAPSIAQRRDTYMDAGWHVGDAVRAAWEDHAKAHPAAHAQQPAPVALTDAQIDAEAWRLEAQRENWEYTGQEYLVVSGHREFARAILAAAGIPAPTTDTGEMRA